MTVDGTRVSGCGRLDEDNAHIIVTENGREIARTVRRLPLSQRVYVSLLKRVKGLPWDGRGLVRRGRPPTMVLREPSMAETAETLRTGGSSLSGTRSSPIRRGPTDVKVDAETEWDACDEAATSQKQNCGSCSCRGNEEVEDHSADTGHWSQPAPRWSWQTRKLGRERWWNRQKTMMTSLWRNTGELRTSWRRFRWTS